MTEHDAVLVAALRSAETTLAEWVTRLGAAEAQVAAIRAELAPVLAAMERWERVEREWDADTNALPLACSPDCPLSAEHAGCEYDAAHMHAIAVWQEHAPRLRALLEGPKA
jgi:hypothetical protein